MRLHPRGHAPVRITDARPGLYEDIRHRQRRYALTMGIRTLCVVLAIVLWQVDRIAAVIALVAGAVLPYIAVVFANAGHEQAPQPPESLLPRQGGPGRAPDPPPPRGLTAPQDDDGGEGEEPRPPT